MSLEEAAQHPIYGSGNPQVIAEYERLQAEHDKYLSWFQRADFEVENLTRENEKLLDLVKGVDDGSGVVLVPINDLSATRIRAEFAEFERDEARLLADAAIKVGEYLKDTYEVRDALDAYLSPEARAVVVEHLARKREEVVSLLAAVGSRDRRPGVRETDHREAGGPEAARRDAPQGASPSPPDQMG